MTFGKHDFVHSLSLNDPSLSYWFCDICDEVWQDDDPGDSDCPGVA